MKYFTIPICLRVKKKTIEEMKELMEKYPEMYKSRSEVVRCAVNELISERRWQEENEHRRNKIK